MTLNYRAVSKVLAVLAAGEGVLILPSVAWSIYYGEWGAVPGILLSAIICWCVAGVLFVCGRRATDQFYQREALLSVGLCWVMMGVLGGLPFVCTGYLDPVGAVFESVSGFTTTGASVIDNLADYPLGVLFWRAFTHWLGGIGIVMMFIAVLPYLGSGGKLLAKTESTGPDTRALRPKIRGHALVLFKIYIGLTVLSTLALLMTRKMDLMEALTHTFGALATGGFSIRQASVAHYDSLAVEIITIVVMVAGATNFALYAAVMGGKWRTLVQDTEWRAMIGILVAATLLMTFNLAGWFGVSDLAAPAAEPGQVHMPFGHALREASFAVSTIMTNTGFLTEDFDVWPYFSRMLLVLLMFVGGSAGSTAGGLKVIRSVMLVKMLYYRLESTFRPYTLRAVRISGTVVPESVQKETMLFVLAYLGFYAVSTLIMSGVGLPFDSAASAVASCMSNSGPGLGLLGGAETYSIVPKGGIVYLTFCMIVGRLEVLTVLVLFMPQFWRSR